MFKNSNIVFLLIIALLNFFYILFPENTSNNYFLFLATTGLQWLLLYFVLVAHEQKIGWGALIALYVASRAPLIFSQPFLEDDFYRYLWDGLVSAQGVSPFAFTPADSKLDAIVFSDRGLINFPGVATIYPPVAQFYFWFVVKTMGAQLWSLKVGAVLIELMTFSALQRLATKENSKNIFILFLFSPLVMKENINSVHFDLLVPCLALFSLSLPSIVGFSVFTLSIWCKITSVILAPGLLLRRRTLRDTILFLGCAGLVTILVWWPFLNKDVNPFKGFREFSGNWVFYASGFYFLEKIFSDSMARVLSLLLFAITWLAIWIQHYRQRIDFTQSAILSYLALLFFSPVVNSWYWLWVFPFFLLHQKQRKILPLLFFTLWQTQLGYAWFVSHALYHQLYYPIYGVLILVLGWRVLVPWRS